MRRGILWLFHEKRDWRLLYREKYAEISFDCLREVGVCSPTQSKPIIQAIMEDPKVTQVNCDYWHNWRYIEGTSCRYAQHEDPTVLTLFPWNHLHFTLREAHIKQTSTEKAHATFFYQIAVQSRSLPYHHRKQWTVRYIRETLLFSISVNLLLHYIRLHSVLSVQSKLQFAGPHFRCHCILMY